MVGGRPEKVKQRKLPTRAIVLTWCVEFERIRESESFEDFEPKHLVAMYIVGHEWVYGVKPEDIVAEAALGAVSAARRMMREYFGNDPTQVVSYLRWLLMREKDTEKWRRDNNQPGRRLSYYDVFVRRQKLDDYRVAQQRAKKP